MTEPRRPLRSLHLGDEPLVPEPEPEPPQPVIPEQEPQQEPQQGPQQEPQQGPQQMPATAIPQPTQRGPAGPIPLYLLDDPNVSRGLNVAFEQAQLELGVDPSRLVVRSLTATELGNDVRGGYFTGPPWRVRMERDTFVGQNRYPHSIEGTVPDMEFHVYVGFMLHGTFDFIESLRFSRAGITRRILPNVLPRQRLLFPEGPVVVGQGHNRKVEFNVTPPVDFIIEPIGFSVEPSGRNVTR